MSIALRRSLPQTVVLGDIEIELKVHPRARSMTLRHDVNFNNFKLSLPKRMSRKAVIEFLQEQQGWMRDLKDRNPDPSPIKEGSMIMIEGIDRVIVRRDGSRGVETRLTDNELIVTCKPDRLQRAVVRFVKHHAEKTIVPMAHKKAAALGRPIMAIKFRDTNSRWGSCTCDGKLSFSWRLIMAPPEVLDYIVAHEVAHLKHMNHSDNFWKTCREWTPNTTFGKHWLKTNACLLHQVQFITRDSLPA